jgi:hypothetical protein
MSSETVHNPDPQTILCRVVDVNNAIQNSFVKFTETENKTLEELANLLKEEMSKIELFAPQIVPNQET